MDFKELLTTRKVLICCGSGGVGKTTLSAALGVKAAELGLKVLVLTIDPARRLANSLGLDHFSDNETQVMPGHFKGELYAAMLDMKRTFDEFILKLAPTPELAKGVLENKLYHQISTALNGSQEYTALEKLYQVTSSGKYDLVILDTPPTKHAIDFLEAPSKIYTLFQDSIIKWFMMPLTTLDKLSLGLMNRGTKAAFKVFEKIGGSEFLGTLTEFFSSIRDWQKILRERSAEVHRILTSGTTSFILVTSFNAIRIEEARYFEQSLKKGGFELSAIIVNRSFPLWDARDSQDQAASVAGDTASPAYKKLVAYYNQLRKFNFSQEQAFRIFAGEPRQNVIFCRLPDFNQDIHDVSNLSELAKLLQSTNFPAEKT